MSDPWNRTSLTPWPFAPGGSGGDRITSLANNTTIALGIVSPTSVNAPVGDILLPIWKLTTGSGSVSGTFTRYIITSEDNVLWTGGLSPNSPSDQSAALDAYLATDAGAANAMIIDQLTVAAAGTIYYFRERFLYALLGNLPTYTSILVRNQSGQALGSVSSGHSLTYALDNYS